MDMINWVINLLRKSFATKIHVFCLDFSSAMLANVIHTPSSMQYLEQHYEIARDVKEKEKIFAINTGFYYFFPNYFV